VKPTRLLFVDDEPGIRATLPIILRRYGFMVAVAASVLEGLEQIHKQEFDVLLCDLNIEREADGYDLVRAMRHAKPDCIIVVLTGNPTMEAAEQGIELGIDDFIAKPASVDHLVATLAEKLRARRIALSEKPRRKPATANATIADENRSDPQEF